MIKTKPQIVAVRLIGLDQATVASAIELLQMRLGDAIILEWPQHGRRNWLAYGALHVDALSMDALPDFAAQVDQQLDRLEPQIDRIQTNVETLIQQRDQAEAQAAELRRVLGKHEQTIAGYGRTSESHLPEVRAALTGEAGQDLLSIATAAERLVEQVPQLPDGGLFTSSAWQELVAAVQRRRGELPGPRDD